MFGKKLNTTYQQKHLTPSVKHVGGGVKNCACFASTAVYCELLCIPKYCRGLAENRTVIKAQQENEENQGDAVTESKSRPQPVPVLSNDLAKRTVHKQVPAD